MPAAPPLPQVRRLRVCLLGGDTVQCGVGKADVAAALLRGLTGDRPGTADPVLDLAFEYGVFERAWRKLLEAGHPPEPEPRAAEEDGGPEPAPEPFVPSDAWGLGPLSAWDGESRIVFDRRGPGEGTPPFEPEPSDETASLCAGNPERLNLGHKRGAGLLGAFREALGASGLDVGALEQVHRDLAEAAKASPRQLVRRDGPCPGLAAAFARFSPEVGDLPGCGAAVLHVFEPAGRPLGGAGNVAMVYACAPNGRYHAALTPSSFLCSLRCIGSNIARLVREYNRAVGAQGAPESWERTTWFESDLRARVEYYLSDRSLATDSFLQEKILGDETGWVDLELIKGCEDVTLQAQLLGALSSSKTVETKVADDGRVCVRRMGGKPPPALEDGSQRKRKYMQGPGSGSGGGAGLQGDRNDPTCWDWVRRGFCPRGDACRYAHGPPAAADGEAPPPAAGAPAAEAAASPEVAAAAAAVGATLPPAGEPAAAAAAPAAAVAAAAAPAAQSGGDAAAAAPAGGAVAAAAGKPPSGAEGAAAGEAPAAAPA